MENLKEKLEAVLTKAENELQEVIVEAAKAGDYRGVDAGRAAAVEICNLKARILKPSSKGELNPKSVASVAKRKAGTKKQKKRKYPKFEVKNDVLVRTGWSKKQRDEYTHKTPRLVFDKTVQAMVRLAKSEAGPFMAEQIIEQVNNLESETVPSYQIYGVIGLLRKFNCIKQIGREGYDIPTDVSTKAKNEWDNLSL